MRGNAAWPKSSYVQIGQLDKTVGEGVGGGGEGGMLNHTRPLLTTGAEHQQFIPGGSQWNKARATTPVCTLNNVA